MPTRWQVAKTATMLHLANFANSSHTTHTRTSSCNPDVEKTSGKKKDKRLSKSPNSTPFTLRKIMRTISESSRQAAFLFSFSFLFPFFSVHIPAPPFSLFPFISFPSPSPTKTYNFSCLGNFSSHK